MNLVFRLLCLARTSILAAISVVLLAFTAAGSNETGTGSYAPGYGMSAAAPVPTADTKSGLSTGYGGASTGDSTGSSTGGYQVQLDQSLSNQVLLTTAITPVYLPSSETPVTVSNNGMVILSLSDQRSRDDDDDRNCGATPEPASASMVALALASLVFLARRAKPTR